MNDFIFHSNFLLLNSFLGTYKYSHWMLRLMLMLIMNDKNDDSKFSFWVFILVYVVVWSAWYSG